MWAEGKGHGKEGERHRKEGEGPGRQLRRRRGLDDAMDWDDNNLHI